MHEPAVGSRAGPAGGPVLGPCGSTRRGLGLRGGRGGGKRVLRLLAGSHQATLSGVHPVASSGVITLSIPHPSQATDPPTAPRVHRRTDPGKPGSPPCRACPCGWSKPPTRPETVRLLSTDSAGAVSSPRANQTPIDFATGPSPRVLTQAMSFLTPSDHANHSSFRTPTAPPTMGQQAASWPWRTTCHREHCGCRPRGLESSRVFTAHAAQGLTPRGASENEGSGA